MPRPSTCSFAIGCACAIVLAGECAGEPVRPQTSAWPPGRIIDLTHPFGLDTIVWPTEQDFRLIVQHAEETPQGYYYASNRLELPEHGGTHLDAPIHFAKGMRTVDQIPLGQLVGYGVRIDVSEACSRDRDYRIRISDLERWETAHGRIPNGSIVLLDTGYAEHWPSREAYLGTERRGPDGVRALHFPGLHPDAAAWLIQERHVKAVGIDTASIDYGQSSLFDAHITLLSRNVPVFENLAHLRRLPARGFTVIALPMLIAGGTGGPLRIIAVVPIE